ncbi:hypothetical protein HDV05_001129, partial [Chytridiales sp. JEL 0842]
MEHETDASVSTRPKTKTNRPNPNKQNQKPKKENTDIKLPEGFPETLLSSFPNTVTCRSSSLALLAIANSLRGGRASGYHEIPKIKPPDKQVRITQKDSDEMHLQHFDNHKISARMKWKLAIRYALNASFRGQQEEQIDPRRLKKGLLAKGTNISADLEHGKKQFVQLQEACWLLLRKSGGGIPGDDLRQLDGVFKTISPFEQFSQRLRYMLYNFMYVESHRRGVVLVREGGMATDWYILLAGVCKKTKR